jgi:hypothetical protein
MDRNKRRGLHNVTKTSVFPTQTILRAGKIDICKFSTGDRQNHVGIDMIYLKFLNKLNTILF